MLSHLSQSLLLSCCSPAAPPSPPVHLHTLLTGIARMSTLMQIVWARFISFQCFRLRYEHMVIVKKRIHSSFTFTKVFSNLYSCNLSWQLQYILPHHSLPTRCLPLPFHLYPGHAHTPPNDNQLSIYIIQKGTKPTEQNITKQSRTTNPPSPFPSLCFCGK